MISIPTKLSSKILDKYSIKNNTFSCIQKDDPRDRINVEIGDAKQPDFLPQTKIMRWDNEVNCSLRLKTNELNPIITTDKDKIKWKTDKLEAHFYDFTNDKHPKGASEIEIILKEKPSTNKIEFTLNTKGVKFLYQPIYTEQFILDEELKGNFINRDAMGSYAVYCAEEKTNYSDDKIYGVGKIGHIYRPKIVDNAGTEVLGDVFVDSELGLLSVTIPQEFLDTAVYPVRHAAGLTFGYETSGSSSSSLENFIRAGQFAPASSGTGDGLSAYLRTSIVNKAVKCNIYNTDNTQLTNGQTNEVTIVVSATFDKWDFTFASAPSFTASTNYILCAWGFSGSGVNSLAYDAGGTDYYQSIAYGSWPSPASLLSDSSTKKSIWVTYTANAGSTSPSLSPSLSPSASPSISPSVSPSQSPSLSPSLSPSVSPSVSPSLSTPEIKVYTKGDYADLPADDTNLENAFTSGNYTDVETDDNVYVDQTATDEYPIFQFKDQNTDSTDKFTPSWKGKTNIAPSTYPVYLQVYNRTLSEWETIDSDSSADADTEFTLAGTINADLSDYYGGSNWISCRVLQDINYVGGGM